MKGKCKKTGKVRYHLESTARDKAIELSKRYYRCTLCHGWHLTSQLAKQKIKKEFKQERKIWEL